ncbi:MAG: MFS transporter, partial [Anaerolineales bacterium]|nr:MFS transporter [Anaerolineales bacterium]
MSDPAYGIPQQPVEDDDISVPRLIGVGLLTRFIVDTSVKIFFPFLPIIANGLGVSEIALGRLVSLRSATGLSSPLFGILADRRGYRYTMRLGLFLAAIGYLIIAVSTNLWMTGLGMMVAGAGTFSFAPTIQAYLSTRLPYNRRARGLGILEYAWALASIIGLFLVGLLIAATNWRIPFFVFSGALFTAGVLYRYLPGAPQNAQPAGPFRWTRASAAGFFNLGENGRSAVAVISCGFLMMFAAVSLFINYGTWLATEYALGAALLGTVELVMGLADLSGSVLVSVISDWLGKRRSVIIGAGIS